MLSEAKNKFSLAHIPLLILFAMAALHKGGVW